MAVENLTERLWRVPTKALLRVVGFRFEQPVEGVDVYVRVGMEDEGPLDATAEEDGRYIRTTFVDQNGSFVKRIDVEKGRAVKHR